MTLKDFIFWYSIVNWILDAWFILTLLFARKYIYPNEKPLWGATFQMQQCGCQQFGIFCGRFTVRFDFGRCKNAAGGDNHLAEYPPS
jgi:hypothetical protein